ncbi:hypothetical protein [Pseudomonas sp. NPDC089569]|uniref:hypothetical protein n=1 Tax=Pseudomonas sp. NPDC089569 TaxID=3390722 RepID=UPI003D04E4F4
MKHRIMGVKKGEDFFSYEKQIPVATEELKVIMGWKSDEDSLHDYKLTENQIIDIEIACSIELPRHLVLYLT